MRSDAAGSRLSGWLEETKRWADGELERGLGSLAEVPPALAEAMRYAVFGGGKRMRPALVRLACHLAGGEDEQAGPPAAAVELIHSYSLVHDDLPCMDDDDLRRGRPTCHRVYGEATAVLVGDGLQSLAFELLARAGGPRSAEMVQVLARAAGPAGMVGGQQLDLDTDAETARGAGGPAGSPGEPGPVREIHARKTGALIAAAAELGALAAPDAGAAQRAALRRYGEVLGLCFQAVDDVLDVVGDASTLGKTPGKDEAAGKPTLVAALGLDGARAEAERLASEARAAARAAGCAEGDLALALVDAVLERRS